MLPPDVHVVLYRGIEEPHAVCAPALLPHVYPDRVILAVPDEPYIRMLGEAVDVKLTRVISMARRPVVHVKLKLDCEPVRLVVSRVPAIL